MAQKQQNKNISNPELVDKKE